MDLASASQGRTLAPAHEGETTMHIGQICTNEATCCTRDETVQGAALLMRRQHVGDVIVVDRFDGASVPVGIVTDRDIVISVIAPGLDPVSLQVGDIMSEDLLTARDTDDVYETIERMRLRGIRRVPVVDARGSLAGIVSADDLLEFLAEEMGELSRISPWQQAHERRARQ
ncbi:CBS domain-containing protein [Massilia consociata]|uniref:CBS domain-containing protein n=1 Tax=Massilia consociata TaxID=760117 RepID=A0ABV6FB13_9BURK